MGGTFTNLNYHIVFSTHSRVPMIAEEMRPRLYEYVGGIVRSEGGVLAAMGGTADHVHLLVRWRPDRTISDLMRVVKSRSSGWIHETFPASAAFAWQEGYGAFTVSESQCDAVRRYIRGQEEHHRKANFQEEFLAFLHKHGITYDERYIWA